MSELFKPKCIWCSAPWSDENISMEVEAGIDGWESSGYYAEVEGVKLKIKCHECGKLMYELYQHGNK